VGGMTIKCLHWDCAEQIEVTKLYCEKHWSSIPLKRQSAIFEAWIYGELEGLRDNRGDNEGNRN